MDDYNVPVDYKISRLHDEDDEDLPLHTDGGQVDDAGEGREHLHVADHLADGGGLVHAGVHLPPQVQGHVQQEEQEVAQGEAGQKQANKYNSE